MSSFSMLWHRKKGMMQFCTMPLECNYIRTYAYTIPVEYRVKTVQRNSLQTKKACTTPAVQRFETCRSAVHVAQPPFYSEIPKKQTSYPLSLATFFCKINR